MAIKLITTRYAATCRLCGRPIPRGTAAYFSTEGAGVTHHPRCPEAEEAAYDVVLRKRGISREVADARPYVAYNRGDWDAIVAVDPRIEANIDGVDRFDQKLRFLRRAVALSSGLVIVRHGLTPGDTPVPQLRPNQPVRYPKRLRGDSIVDGRVVAHKGERIMIEAKYLLPPGPQAKRIDVHPAVDRDAPEVFFGIEGSLKADAMLTAGAASISVPSVTLWGGPDLESVISMLEGRTVYVVPDSDWADKWLVAKQAHTLVAVLRRSHVDAHLVAPPGQSGCKGVDDFLATGATLDDLEHIELVPPTEDVMRQHFRSLGPRDRIDARETDMDVLRYLQSICTRKGRVAAFSSQIAAMTGHAPRTVRDSLTRLIERRGCLRVRAPSRAEFSPVLQEWSNTPTEWLILHPDLIPRFETKSLRDWRGFRMQLRKRTGQFVNLGL